MGAFLLPLAAWGQPEIQNCLITQTSLTTGHKGRVSCTTYYTALWSLILFLEVPVSALMQKRNAKKRKKKKNTKERIKMKKKIK